MKMIPLTQGKWAVVDDSDYDWLMQFSWYYTDNPGYAQATVDGVKNVYMHHLLLPAKAGFERDHENRDKLDNRRSNLRYLCHADNIRNRGPQANNTSGFKGVHRSARAGGAVRWRAITRVWGVTRHLGTFNTKEEAARTYEEFQRQRGYGNSQANL